jgi:hypothetical protein
MGRYKVRCRICGRFFSKIDWSHLRKHNITTEEYKKQFPNVKLCSTLIMNKSIYRMQEELNKKIINPIFKKELEEKRIIGGKKGIKKTHFIIKEKRLKDQFYNEKYIMHRKKIAYLGGKTLQEKRKDNKKLDKKLRVSSKINGHKGGTKTHQLYGGKEQLEWCSKAGKIGWIKGQESIRKNKPYWFMGVPFASNSERNCAKLFHKYFGWIPKKKVNCHKKVGKCEYDFIILGKFVDFHPKSFYTNSIKDYYQKRRRNLDKNNLKNKKLFILQNLEDVMNFINIEKFNKK